MSGTTRRKVASGFIGAGCALTSCLLAAGDYFNPQMLKGGGLDVVDDLSVFEEAGSMIPGNYFVDIYLNRRKVGAQALDFHLEKNAQGRQRLEGCLSVDKLKEWGVRVEQYPQLAGADGCANLAAIAQARSDFAFSSQRLDLSIPQVALSAAPRGSVPPELWDDGETALLLNYSLSGAQESTQVDDHSSDGQYANLLPGLNIGSWRLRNYSTWTSATDEAPGGWESIYTYAQRSVPALGANLTLGDSASPGEVFDTVPLRGVQLATDEEMLPDSQRGFAPVVRGIARTNAKITIRQNGYVIYQNYVAPGAFSISDLYPTGSNGDLDVTLSESDGSEQHFTVPFATLPILRREGSLKYSLASGQYRPAYDAIERTRFSQATGIYGLGSGFTLYAGVQNAEVYDAFALGLGKNLGDFGALSLDVTQARSQPRREQATSGQSWRVRYSKNVVQSGTNFAIAAYRYSTQGYSELTEVLDTYRDDGLARLEHPRNRFELSVDQSLGERMGTLTFGAFSETHWNSSKKNQSLSFGYSNTWDKLTMGINLSFNKNEFDNRSTLDDTSQRSQSSSRALSINFSIPLDGWMGGSYASYSMNTSNSGPTSNRVGVTGRGMDRQLTWGVQQGYTDGGRGNDGNLSLDYLGAYGEFSSSYYYDDSRSRATYRAKGGAVVHRDGVTFGQTLGESIALVETPEAANVGVRGKLGVATDGRGFAIDPYLAPFRSNTVALAVETLPEHVEVGEALRDDLVPTRGAVLRASFKTRVGLRALVTLRRQQGGVVPFGAQLAIAGADAASGDDIVGSDGKAYLTGLPPTGRLIAHWGSKGAPQRCEAPYDFSREPEVRGIVLAQLVCK